jgi:hypothetical protein
MRLALLSASVAHAGALKYRQQNAKNRRLMFVDDAAVAQ